MKYGKLGKRTASRILAVMLILTMAITGIPPQWFGGRGFSYGASLSAEEILSVAETIEDEKAKAEIIAAVKDGAQVQFRYTAEGKVASYQIIREGIAKAHEDMTEEEKRSALDLLISRGTVPNRITVNGAYYSLNITLWMERGIIVYGETKKVNEENSVTSGSNYKDGQYRFWGYDVNGGLYGNDDFPRDSDSGTPAYQKDWLTTAEIRESAVARRYIGEHAMSANGRYSDSDKRETARLWLNANSDWKKAGITADYILEHFYFNSVISDSGLTMGQFTGVHKSRQSGTLYYQSFAVQGKTMQFEISEGTVEERILIEEETPPAPPEPVEPEEPEEVSVEMEVSLSLPSVTYEGHPTAATDSTSFFVDGTRRSAARVYGEGLAKNSFRLPSGGGTIQKNRSVPTRAEAVFDAPGTYPVSLTVKTSDGKSGSDQKTIDVLKTPSILHSLTGTQKQNRAQTLNVWVATHPKRPLEDMWIEIKDQATGETVRLVNNVGKESENKLKNGTVIKTRPIQGLESDQLFTNCQLEFLTKNAEEQEFSYTIYVKDSGGRTDQVTQSFTVVPDRPPQASIEMDETFLRQKGQNRAAIQATDHSQTDGDQLERQWSFVPLKNPASGAGTVSGSFSDVKSMAGYEDLSFGTGQKISFPKDGVGPFRVRLTVKDVWTEPTLPEYVTEADRLSNVATKDAEVINTAPQVSMKPRETKRAELLFLSDTPEVHQWVQGQLSQVTAALLEQGYDGTVTAKLMAPSQRSEDRPWAKTIEVDTPFGYQGNFTALYEKDNFIADDQRLYKIDATWRGSDIADYPEAPYTITAWNGETGAVEWTYTFDDRVLAVPENGPHFVQDDSGTYLYFVSGQKTLVLDKATGAKLTVLPFTVGEQCFVEQNRILTVKNDGIYRINTGSGSVSKIYSGVVGGGAARFGGKLQFVLRSGQTLYRASMNMNTQVVTLQKLSAAASASAVYDAETFCVDGKLLVKETAGNTIRFLLFDENGALSRSVSHTGTELTGTAVRDGSGNTSYTAFISSEKKKDSYYIYVTCYDLRTGKKAEVSMSNKNGYPCEPEIIAAEQDDGLAYVVAGGYTAWIAGDGWANGPAHGYPQRTKTIRFDMTAQSGQVISNAALQLEDTEEYGRSSDGYAVIQSAQNGQYQSPPSGNITTLYRRYQTDGQMEQRYRARYLTRDGSADRQGAFVLTEQSQQEDNLSQMVAQWLDDDTAENSAYLNLKETAAGGRLWRTAELKPDTTYYYEYDLFTPKGNLEDAEDILSAKADIFQRSKQLTGSQYRVTGAMTEQFDNNRMSNSYFSGAQPENLKNDRFQVSPEPEQRRVQTASAALTFTVEQGQRAVLSFDYLIERFSDDGYFANRIKIDGNDWKMPLTKGVFLQGHYTHPFLLEAGKHTLELFAGTYGTPESLTAIDDLTVEYVETSTALSAPEKREMIDGNASDKKQIGEGWARISGSFHTPAETIAYQGIEGTILAETAGKGKATTLEAPSYREKRLNFLIPSGETAIYAGVRAESTPVKKNGRYYGIKWTVAGNTVMAYPDSYFGTNDEGRLNSRGLPLSFDFILPAGETDPSGWGDPAVRMSFNGTSSSGGGAALGQAVLASVKQLDASVKDREFFLRTGGTDAGIYAANLRFRPAVQIGFVPGNGGERGVANLRIYTLKDGVRLYVSEEDITEAKERNRWTAEGVSAEVKSDGTPVEEENSMVYAKGQLVYCDVDYSDYENDPSKASYWKYTHVPYNDGPHPQAAVVLDGDGNVTGGTGQILSEPIRRFYVDGKYLVEHWQTDSTGDPAYDKDSNIASMILYIGGGGNAPWINSISLSPSGASEGDDVTIKVSVDDLEKDPLRLETEIYREGKLIHRQQFKNLTANSQGKYPLAAVNPIRSISAGKYEVVCTVRDESGTGIGNRQFTIKPAGSVEGQVAHTQAWDSNRRAYNLNLFGEKATLYNTPVTIDQYLKYPTPRPRGSNVFWAGEEFVLTADAGGKPTSVTAQIGSYQTRMTSTGQKTADGKTIYKGTLWDKAMRSQWGKTPQAMNVVFRAYYAGNTVKEHSVPVILDSNTEYWLLHRYK